MSRYQKIRLLHKSGFGQKIENNFFDRGSKKKIQQEKLNQQRNEETTNLSFFYFSTQTIILLTLKPMTSLAESVVKKPRPTDYVGLIQVLGQQ